MRRTRPTTHAEKWRIANIVRALDKRQGAEMRYGDMTHVYKCDAPECWGWHLSTQHSTFLHVRLYEVRAEAILFGSASQRRWGVGV